MGLPSVLIRALCYTVNGTPLGGRALYPVSAAW